MLPYAVENLERPTWRFDVREGEGLVASDSERGQRALAKVSGWEGEKDLTTG